MAEKRINIRTLKNHWHYSWWKYLLLCVIGIFGVNLVFTMTAYRSPEEKKIEVYICNSYIDTVKLHEDLWPLIQAAAPDQEELSVMNIDLTSEDPYTRMQYTTYTAAQQGDVYLLPKHEADMLAADSVEYAFVELSQYVESGVLNVDGMDLSRGMYVSSTGEEGLYGIPAHELYGLLDYYNDPAGSLFYVVTFSGNEENAVKTLGILLDMMRQEKPEGYDDMMRQKEEQQSGAPLFM